MLHEIRLLLRANGGCVGVNAIDLGSFLLIRVSSLVDYQCFIGMAKPMLAYVAVIILTLLFWRQLSEITK